MPNAIGPPIECFSAVTARVQLLVAVQTAVTKSALKSSAYGNFFAVSTITNVVLHRRNSLKEIPVIKLG